MATVGLKYSLEIELSNARKQLERFKKEMGDGLNSMGKRRRAGDDAYGPLLPTAAQIRQSLNNIEREAKRAQKGGSYGPFLPTSSQIRQSLNTIEREAKRAQRTQKSETYGPFMPTAAQIRESLRAQERAAEQAARARQKEAREAERDARRLASRLDAINAGRMRANSMGGFTSPDAVNIEKQARAKMLAELTNLEVNANKMGAYAFQEKMRQIHSSFSQAIHQMKSAQADFTNQRNINNTGLNFSRAFQGQQMVEDFAIGYQLNGMQGALRGATNNLSFLGASVGGPLGVTALIASLGLTLANTTGLFDRFTEASKRAKEELDNYFKSREHLLQLEERFLGRDQGDATSSGLTREVMEINQKTEARERELTVQEENLRLLRAYAEVQDQIRAFGFNQAGNAGVSKEDIKRYGDYLRERESITGQLGVNGVSVDADPDRVEEQTKTLRSELQGLAEDYEEAKAAQEEYTAAFAASNATFEAVREKAGGLSGKNDAIQSHLSDVQGGLGLIEEQRNNSPALARLREQANLFRPGGRDADPEQFQAVLQKIAELNDVFADQAEDLLATESQRIMLANELVEKADKARDQQEQSLAIVQEQAQAARELAQVEDQRLETIKEQRRVQREQFEASVFEARKGIRGAEAQRDEDNLAKQADSARDRVRRRADQLRAQLAIGSRNLSRQGARGPGGRDMRADISQAGAWIDQQEQAYLQNIEREEERRRTGITARRDADIQKMNADREGLLKQRAGGLSGQAQEAFSAGQFDRARQLIDQSRGALQELQALQMQQVGEGTPEQMRAALDRATATQQQMDQTFGLEAQVTTASRDAALQAFQQNVNLADQYEKELQQIKALQDSLKDAEFIKQLEVDRAKQIRDYFTEIANIATRTEVVGAVAEASGDPLVAPSLFQGALDHASFPALPPSAGATGPVSNFAPNVTINQAGGSAVGVIAELALQGLFTGIRAGR